MAKKAPRSTAKLNSPADGPENISRALAKPDSDQREPTDEDSARAPTRCTSSAAATTASTSTTGCAPNASSGSAVRFPSGCIHRICNLHFAICNVKADARVARRRAARGSAARLRAKVRRHPRDRRSAALRPGAPVVAPGQRENLAVPRDRRRARQVGTPPEAGRRARRRDRRAGRGRPADRISTAPGPHPSRGRTGPDVVISQDRLHRLRRPERGRPRPARRAAPASAARSSSACSRAIAIPACGSARWCVATAVRCTSAPSSRDGKASSRSTRTRSTSRASGRPTGASSRSPRSRSSSSAAGPSRARRAPGSARCCSASMKDRRLVYVGHTGTGFNERELVRVMKLLRPLETDECPFTPEPTHQRAAALGRAAPGRPGQVHGVDRRREAAASRVSRPARRQEPARCGARAEGTAE